jgi:hypothetical protein
MNVGLTFSLNMLVHPSPNLQFFYNPPFITIFPCATSISLSCKKLCITLPRLSVTSSLHIELNPTYEKAKLNYAHLLSLGQSPLIVSSFLTQPSIDMAEELSIAVASDLREYKAFLEGMHKVEQDLLEELLPRILEKLDYIRRREVMSK